MDIQEFTERLSRIATVKKYRISSRDREAAGIALAIVLELEKPQPQLADRFEKFCATRSMTCAAGREREPAITQAMTGTLHEGSIVV